MSLEDRFYALENTVAALNATLLALLERMGPRAAPGQEDVQSYPAAEGQAPDRQPLAGASPPGDAPDAPNNVAPIGTGKRRGRPPKTPAPTPDIGMGSKEVEHSAAAAPSQPLPQAEPAKPAPTYLDIRTALLELGKVKGNDLAIKVMEPFGANLREVKESDYLRFLATIEQAKLAP